MTAFPVLAVLALAFVHLFSVRLAFLDRVPRSRVLSFGGGVAVALVFLDPARTQETLGNYRTVGALLQQTCGGQNELPQRRRPAR